jgi:hypothetical protein
VLLLQDCTLPIQLISDICQERIHLSNDEALH